MQSISEVLTSVDVGASPDDVFAVLADPSRHADFDGSGTILGCAEQPSVLGPGSVFVMRMRLNGTTYRSNNEVVEYEPGRVIAWRTTPSGRALGLLFGGQVWRFRLEPSEAGCTVTHTWDPSRLIRSPIPTRMMRFEHRNRDGMESSLAKLKALWT